MRRALSSLSHLSQPSQLSSPSNMNLSYVTAGALGTEFDSSKETRDMRTNSWVSAVYARLQRRFVRFLSGNVEEYTQEQDIGMPLYSPAI